MTCDHPNLTFNDQVCAGCAEANCCAPLQACDASVECGDYLSCVANCSDQPCVDTCDTMYPTGMAELDALDSCLGSSCTDECGGGGNFPICDSGFATADEAVSTCLGTNCCAEATACYMDELGCRACLLDQDQAACDMGTLDEDFDTCASTNCP
jgi:hypothetical protein